MTASALRPRAAALVMAGLCLGAALIIVASRPWLTTPPPGAPSIYLRLLLGVAWTALSAGSLASAYLSSRAGFGVICGVTTAVGLATMAIGRQGLAGLDAGLAACIAAVLLTGLAGSIWLRLRSPAITAADRVWRLFLWLSLVGTVYLYSAEPQEAGAQIAALSLSLLICAMLVPVWPSIVRVATALIRAVPKRLSLVIWAAAIFVLVINAIVARTLGLSTPQLAVGPLSLAPYFLAAALALAAVALDVECARVDGLRPLLRMGAGLLGCASIYVFGLSESGTLAILALGTAAVLLISGPPLLATAAVVAIVGTQMALQSPALIEAIRPHQPRVAERLLDWSNQAAPPEQLLRVAESLQLAGAIGHAGAARLRFVVGPEVAKDYAPALIAAQGGWIGLAVVLVGSVLLLVELYLGIRRAQQPIARGLQTATLALVIGSLLVTTLWLGGVTPFVGVPLPLLARAGSHLMALAGVLLACDAVSQADRALAEGRHR